jgi:hypothetical protein
MPPRSYSVPSRSVGATAAGHGNRQQVAAVAAGVSAQNVVQGVPAPPRKKQKTSVQEVTPAGQEDGLTTPRQPRSDVPQQRSKYVSLYLSPADQRKQQEAKQRDARSQNAKAKANTPNTPTNPRPLPLPLSRPPNVATHQPRPKKKAHVPLIAAEVEEEEEEEKDEVPLEDSDSEGLGDGLDAQEDTRVTKTLAFESPQLVATYADPRGGMQVAAVDPKKGKKQAATCPTCGKPAVKDAVLLKREVMRTKCARQLLNDLYVRKLVDKSKNMAQQMTAGRLGKRAEEELVGFLRTFSELTRCDLLVILEPMFETQ